MACRAVLRSCVLLSEPWPWRPSLHRRPALASSTSSSSPPSLLRPSRVRVFHGASPLRCSHGEAPSPASSSSSSSPPDDQGPPQEAVLKAISELSKSEGRVAQTTNVVIGGTVTDDATDEWLVLDQKGHVTQKLSSRGKYVSVNIGPIRVVSSEQVQAVYNAMRRDDRMKYFL
uniref:Uncharacterized protein LOC105042118 isoform X2 n=1 Tax=Elaeis guineensis var. tenera TaxID=51953 RepID=A0A8N4F2U3_ELAGV|nr:uncharacterized protein LOC105042118 isoform X2 [Elaeis guineensis]